MPRTLESKILIGGLVAGAVSMAVGAYLEKNGAIPFFAGLLAIALCGILLLEPK